MTSDADRVVLEDEGSVNQSCTEKPLNSAEQNNSIKNGLSENSRVVRKVRHSSQVKSGSQGVVISIREETRPNKKEATPKSLLVQVQWDNGTLSFVGIDAIEAV